MAFRVSGFVLRTPLLPIDELLALADPDRDVVRRRIHGLVQRAAVRDALFVAAPALAEALEREPGEKAEAAVFRYVARMAGRPTPFGLCAGCTTGAIGTSGRLELGDADASHSRLDGDLLLALIEALESDPAVREHLVYRPNPSLYHAGGRLRYVEARSDAGRRACRLVAAEPTAELLATLDRARPGATREQLVAAAAGDGRDREQAVVFVDEMIASQLLVSDIAPAVIGPEPVAPLAARLRAVPAARAVAEVLEDAVDELAQVDAAPAGARRHRLSRLRARLQQLPVTAPPEHTFQVDLVRPAPVLELPVAVLEALRQGVEVVRRLPPAPQSGELRRLRERFAERYGDREVPLAHALDADVGIGVDGEPEPARADVERPPEVDRMLLRLAAGAGAREVRLSARELAVLDAQPAQPLPGAFAVVAALAAASDAALRAGSFEVRLIATSGPSGARLLGRFCHGDPHMRALVAAHLEHEQAQDPGAIYAEISHLSEGRTANVLLRPRLREHEIVLLGGCTAPADARLHLEDLTLSLEDERFVLRSQRLGRRVIPRLTSAHDYRGGGIGLYRFLGLLQDQDAPALGWSWGPATDLPFTPRVRVGNVVLAPARWNVDADELADAAAVRARRDELALPRVLALEAGDAPLPIDLDNPLGVDLLLREARRRESLTLVEMWPGPDRLAVHGRGGRYAHELIVPLAAPPAPARERPRPAPPQIRRSFGPGSQWLYAKLYTGRGSADRLLAEDVAAVVEAARRAEAVVDWHFLRYADPDFHVRLRFRGEPRQLREEVQPIIAEAAERLMDEGRVWRFQLDTYDRELERYGGDCGIELAEAAFTADSDAVLELLGRRVEMAAHDRWHLAVPATLLLARDLLGDEERAVELLGRMRDELAQRLDVPASLLARRLRAARATIEPLLDAACDGRDEVLARRGRRLTELGDELARRAADGLLARPPEEIAASLVHMHVNRLLRSGDGAAELAVYDAAERLVQARAARARAAAEAT